MLDSVAIQPQPAPTGQGVDVTELAVADLKARREAGILKYGRPLHTHNGRDALVDAYQEALDQMLYLRQRIEEERDGRRDFSANASLRDFLFDFTRWATIMESLLFHTPDPRFTGEVNRCRMLRERAERIQQIIPGGTGK